MPASEEILAMRRRLLARIAMPAARFNRLRREAQAMKVELARRYSCACGEPTATAGGLCAGCQQTDVQPKEGRNL